jgi:hypothetical protein
VNVHGVAMLQPVAVPAEPVRSQVPFVVASMYGLHWLIVVTGPGCQTSDAKLLAVAVRFGSIAPDLQPFLHGSVLLRVVVRNRTRRALRGREAASPRRRS